MPWAAHADVTGAWIGDDVPTDTSKIDLWLAKAEREVRFRVPDIDARIAEQAAETPTRTQLADLAKDVVVAMVIRVFRNPKNLRQTTTTTGPFSESSTAAGDLPGSLELTDSEFKKLTERPSGAFEIDLMPATAPFWVPAWGLLDE